MHRSVVPLRDPACISHVSKYLSTPLHTFCVSFSCFLLFPVPSIPPPLALPRPRINLCLCTYAIVKVVSISLGVWVYHFMGLGVHAFLVMASFLDTMPFLGTFGRQRDFSPGHIFGSPPPHLLLARRRTERVLWTRGPLLFGRFLSYAFAACFASPLGCSCLVAVERAAPICSHAGCKVPGFLHGMWMYFCEMGGSVIWFSSVFLLSAS